MKHTPILFSLFVLMFISRYANTKYVLVKTEDGLLEGADGPSIEHYSKGILYLVINWQDNKISII